MKINQKFLTLVSVGLIVLVLFSFYLVLRYQKIEQQDDLDSWVGSYQYIEHDVPAEQDGQVYGDYPYELIIYKENGTYKATLTVDGFQTMIRLNAKVQGDEKIAKIAYESNWPGDHEIVEFNKGEVMFSLEKSNSEYKILWGSFGPNEDKSRHLNDYFIKIK